MAHDDLNELVSGFHVRPPCTGDLAQYVPRADNSAADAAANQALDTNSFLDVWTDEMQRLLYAQSGHPELAWGLLFSFDGAS
eukprot:3735364-Karenia_brevis.AAC.1